MFLRTAISLHPGTKSFTTSYSTALIRKRVVVEDRRVQTRHCHHDYDLERGRIERSGTDSNQRSTRKEGRLGGLGGK